MVRVRFAPSPTGFLHIGGARTALFNWLYACSQGGVFILRIEDTDKDRSKEEYLKEILESMQWLGMPWDEFYRQSDRFEIYRQHARRLLDEGKAFQDGAAVILKISARKQEVSGGTQPSIKWFDLIRGEISFEEESLKDEVLMKSDGTPTYSFACVVDDALMEISHVIRGEDHISNTPKQIVMYEALGFKPPKFAHLPLIMDEEGGRMSKRAGAVAVMDYKARGFLPEALVNYLMLLGWSPGNNQEIVTPDAAIKKFSIKKVNKAAAAFSMDKLKWINAQYIKQKDTRQLVELIIPFLKEKGYADENTDKAYLEGVVKLYQSRMSTFEEFLERADYVFADTVALEAEAKEKYLAKDYSAAFQLLGQRLGQVKDFSATAAEEAFRSAADELGLKAGDLVHPVRVALTGKSVGPGLFETMFVLGQEKTVKRLLQARFFFEKR
jgi:glutamyl-tRNA synthetase